MAAAREPFGGAWLAVAFTVVAMGLHGSLAAQAPGAGPVFDPAGTPSQPQAVRGAGITYLDLWTGETPAPALELTYLAGTPVLWRAGLMGGLLASVRGAVYAHGGLQVPVSLPLGLTTRTSFSVGLYEGGRGFDLGHALEFRSQFLIERAVNERVRVSAFVFHLSNAGIGRRNPGLEGVGLGVSVVPPARPRLP